MNPAHLHLLLNHMPILGTFFGILILFFGYFKKNQEIKKLALLIFIFAAIIVVPVYLTGEPAEDSIKNMPGVTEEIIEAHENLALYSFILLDLLGAVSIFALFIEKKNNILFKNIILFSLFLSFSVMGFMGLTALKGGEIRHTEIRSGYIAPAQQVTPAEKDKD